MTGYRPSTSARRPAALAAGLVLGLVLGSHPATAQLHPAEPQTASLTADAATAVPSAEPQAPPVPEAATLKADPEEHDGPILPASPEVPQPPAGSDESASEAVSQSDTRADARTDARTDERVSAGPAPEDTAPEPFHLPIIRNEKVEPHIRFFNVAIRDRFEKWLERLGSYWPHVESIFREFDLPSDLVYLSLVESGFNPHAYSRAKATGPWQFMKGTARVYGLRVDRYVDERRDPIKSTVAAARYLRDLYDLFGTWPLALAAYNAGEGKVLRALAKTRAESFWEIAKTRHLRRETKDYVPRYMAATIIAKNPDEYGFPSSLPDPHQFEEVAVSRSVHLREVAKVSGIPFAELRRLNPELRRDVTPPTDPVYFLKVPVDTKEQVVQALDRVPTWKPGPVRVAKKGRASVRRGNASERSTSGAWYRVRAGDSLWTIAKRFQMSVKDLIAINKLSSRKIKPGDLLAIQR